MEDLTINQDLIKETITKEAMNNKLESLVEAIEVEVEGTIKEKATKVANIMEEVVIQEVKTQTILPMVILTINTQDNQGEVVTTVVKIQDQTMVVNQFQIKGMAKPLSTEKRSCHQT